VLVACFITRHLLLSISFLNIFSIFLISSPQGLYLWPNGAMYDGEYEFDKRHGRGVFKWNDGRVYDGMYSEDKRHGSVRSCLWYCSFL
jgi:MORN repeat